MSKGCGELVVMSREDVVAIWEEVVGRLRCVERHGDWSECDAERVFAAVAEGFDAYREAFVAGRIAGRHGQVDGLYDLVVAAIEGIGRLTV